MEAFSFLQQNVPRETFERLKVYVDTLLKWQEHINLVSRGTIRDVWARHILDSFQLLQYIHDRKISITDLGSGAGFPGMVLAICGCENVVLVEANSKKVGFLNEVARLTHTNVTISQKRIEESFLSESQVFVSRALASLSDLFELISPFTSLQTSCIFLKGGAVEEEITSAHKKWMFSCQQYPSITDESGRVVIIQQLTKRGN